MKDKTILAIIVGCGILVCGASFSKGKPAAEKAASNWRSIGPAGGDVRSLAFFPKDQNEMFAVAGMSVYWTKNAGASWKRIVSVDEYLTDVAPDPITAGCYWLLSNDYIFCYINYTKRWLKQAFGKTTYAGGGRITFDQGNSKILHVGGRSYVGGAYHMAYLKSEDWGQSWKARIVGSSQKYGSLNELELSPADPKTLFAAGWYQDSANKSFYKIFRSTDGGIQWTEKTPPIAAEVKAIALHPSDKNRLYAATNSNIWRSTNGGASWKPNSGEAAGYCLALDPLKEKTLYSGHLKKIYKSTDGGIKWKAMPEKFYGTCRVLLVSSSGTIFAGTMAGIYRSLDGGKTWAPRQKGLNAGMASAVSSAPSSPNVIYAALYYDGLYRSANAGKSWTRLPDFTGSDYVGQIMVNPRDPDTVLILIKNFGPTPDELLKSVNGGKSWTKLFSGFLEGFGAGATDFDRLFAVGQVQEGTSNYPGYHESSDGGKTWTARKVSSELGSVGLVLAPAPSNEKTLYLGGGFGLNPRLFRSTDGGTSWAELSVAAFSSWSAVNTVAVDPDSPNTLFVGASGLYKSEDGGKTWSKKRTDPTYHVLIHSQSPDTIYAGCLDSLFRSEDNGNNWQSFKEGLVCTYVKRLNLDATNNILYAALWGGSISKRQL